MDNNKILIKELHTNAYKNYDTRKVNVIVKNDIWGMDLVVMGKKSADENKGYFYLLTVIDLYSRYAWAIPTYTKEAGDIKEAFEKIGHQPFNLWVDKGKEFQGVFRTYCNKHNINIYSTHGGDSKSAYTERFNRTLRMKMQLYFDEHKTIKYLNILDKLLYEYNHEIHRSIKNTPYNVYFKDEKVKVNKNIEPIKESNFKINDYVRISYNKGVFEKGYTQKWSNEVYKIYRIDDSVYPIMFYIKDLKDEEIDGIFYEQELLKTSIPNYKVIDEVVIEKEGRKNVYIVSFKGLPQKFNERLYKKEYDELLKLK